MTVVLRDAFIGSYPLSQKFGENPAVYRPYGLAGHEGVDFATPNGVPVLSATQGLVLHAGHELAWSAYGNFVEVWDDKQHCAVLYGHLRDVSVKVGQRVWFGELLGHTDNTGHSTGPHLHLGLCLTDAAGNRLNRGNGFGGWVNSLDAHIATWQISNPKSPIPSGPLPPVIPPPPAVEPAPPKPMPDPLQGQLDAANALIAAMKADWAKVGNMVNAYK